MNLFDSAITWIIIAVAFCADIDDFYSEGSFQI